MTPPPFDETDKLDGGESFLSAESDSQPLIQESLDVEEGSQPDLYWRGPPLS
jgi:hypothetical protein